MAMENTTTSTTIQNNDDNNEKDPFDFTWDVSSDPIQKVLDLKEEVVKNGYNPRRFTINCPEGISELSHCSVLGDLFCVFCHFKTNNIIWNFFRLDLNDDDAEYEQMSNEELIFIGCLMYSANSMSIFKDFEFHAPWDFMIDGNERMPRDVVMAKDLILSGITLNENIEGVTLFPVGVLTKADVQHLAKLLRTTKTLKKLALSEMHAGLEDPSLFQSLAENKTLEEVDLQFQHPAFPEFSDVSMSNMILSLKGHPSLRELTIVDQNGSSELNLTAYAIGLLLRYSTTLSVLTLTYDHFQGVSYSSIWKFEHVFQGLKHSRSLKTIHVKNVFCGRLHSLLSVSMSPLERIVYCQVEGWSETLANVTRMERRMDPIELQLHDGSIPIVHISIHGEIIEHQDQNIKHIKHQYEKLKQMLHAHPEIRLTLVENSNIEYEGNELVEVDIDAEFETDQHLLHLYNFNLHGRYLLDYARRNNKRVPLSLWPLVLENSNDKPSILFEFLKSSLIVC